MVEALLGGVYSELTQFTLGLVCSGSELAATALARVLSSGRYPNLEELCLGRRNVMVEDVGLGLTRILEAMNAGYCQNLRHLAVVDAPAMDTHRARILGQILGDGACPLLEVLDLGYNKFLTGEGLAHVVDALEQGACPHLRSINLPLTKIGSTGAAALVRGLTSGSLSHLQSLDLTGTEIGDEPTKDVLKALAGSCRDLRKIDLTNIGASSQAFAAFHEALRANVWPRLEEIKLCYRDEEMAGDLVSTLAAAGVGTSLRYVELEWPVNQGVTARRLAETFRQGACPSLQQLTYHSGCGSYYYAVPLMPLSDLHSSLRGRASFNLC